MNLARAADQLFAHALSQPGAWEDHPWGERVAKVGKKVFLFFGHDNRGGRSLTLAVKLPRSGVAALDRPECSPTGYGLGKSGWVSAKYEDGDVPPLDVVKAWIDESYRAVAPKKLVKMLDVEPPVRPEPKAKRETVRIAKKKTRPGAKPAPAKPVRKTRGG